MDHGILIMKKFIAIAGNMIGKTTLVDFHRQTYGFEPVLQAIHRHPYLDDFYKEMETMGISRSNLFFDHKFKTAHGTEQQQI